MHYERINFETLKDYWLEVDHFKNPHKKNPEFIRTLGPYTTTIERPRSICYGLFDAEYMIGGTQLVEWEEGVIRYRTINIREQYRGNDLGWYLLENAWNEDWQAYSALFGWVRDTHIGWSLKHGFEKIGEEYDNHVGMVKQMG